MSANFDIDEVKWWDDWNTKFRTTAVPEDWGAIAKTGWLALHELEDLGLEAASILEVGCGTGWVAERLARCRRYVGIDLSPAAIEAARSRGTKGEFVAGDFLTWEGHPASFDIVVMVDTIAYFRDQDRAMHRAWGLLKPGGHLVLTTVNPFVYSRMSTVGAPGKGQVRHWLTKRAMSDLLLRNGFAVLKSYTAFPAGDQGILHYLNSGKLNRAATVLFGQSRITRTKERLGLGQYRIAVAQRSKQWPGAVH